MDIGNLYNVLIGEITRQTNTNTNISRNIGSSVSFGDILSAVSNRETVSAKDMFSVAFPDYSVKVKSGECSVPDLSWRRKDFPVTEGIMLWQLHMGII